MHLTIKTNLHISLQLHHLLSHFLINKQTARHNIKLNETDNSNTAPSQQRQVITTAAYYRHINHFFKQSHTHWRQLSKYQPATSLLHLLIISLFQAFLELSRKLIIAELADRLQIQLKELCPSHKVTVPFTTWQLKQSFSSWFNLTYTLWLKNRTSAIFSNNFNKEWLISIIFAIQNLQNLQCLDV